MSRLRRAALATAVVQCFAIVGLVLSFVTVPLYLAWLGSERYGLMLTAQACAGYLSFSDAGLSWSSLLLISHAHGRGDRGEIARIVGNSLSLAGLSALVVAAVSGTVWLLLRHQVSFLPLPSANLESQGLALAIGLQVIVSLGFSSIYNIFFGLQESHVATIYQGVGRILGVGLSLWAASRGFSIGVVVAAGALGMLLCGIACALHARLKYRWAFQWDSFWDREQIRRQYRTGAKSFCLQVGRTLVGSAPVLAISSQAGASAVPAFTVALTLINTPLNIVTYFNAMLQSGYGEAVGKQDYLWIRATLQAILRNTLLLQALLAGGFLSMAGLTITFWTSGRLQTTPPLLVSALIVGMLIAVKGSLQFALSGVNRHRVAGIAELLNGLGCLVLAPLAVRFAGPEWVGLGVLVATALTSGWLLPAEVRKHIGVKHVLPSKTFLLALFAIAGAAGAAGWAVLHLSTFAARQPMAALLVTGMVVFGTYVGMLSLLLPEDAKQLVHRLLRWRQIVPRPPVTFGGDI